MRSPTTAAARDESCVHVCACVRVCVCVRKLSRRRKYARVRGPKKKTLGLQDSAVLGDFTVVGGGGGGGGDHIDASRRSRKPECGRKRGTVKVVPRRVRLGTQLRAT
jgi:hypothetical protein